MAELSPVRGEMAPASFASPSPLQRMTAGSSTSIGRYSPSNGGGVMGPTVGGNEGPRSGGALTSSSTYAVQRSNKSQCYTAQQQQQQQQQAATDLPPAERPVNSWDGSNVSRSVVRKNPVSGLSMPPTLFADDRQQTTMSIGAEQNVKTVGSTLSSSVDDSAADDARRHRYLPSSSDDGGHLSSSPAAADPPSLAPSDFHRCSSASGRVARPEIAPSSTGGKRRRSRSASHSASDDSDSREYADDDDDDGGVMPSDVSDDPMESGDGVHSFVGSVIYNPDGSAYVVEDIPAIDVTGDGAGDAPPHSVAFDVLRLPRHDGAVVDRRRRDGSTALSTMGAEEVHGTGELSIPLVVSVAVACQTQPPEPHYQHQRQSEQPPSSSSSRQTISWYRIMRDDNPSVANGDHHGAHQLLMCLTCKLTFARWRSMVDHALRQHGVETTAEQQSILATGSSAILQGVGSISGNRSTLSLFDLVSSSSLATAATLNAADAATLAAQKRRTSAGVSPSLYNDMSSSAADRRIGGSQTASLPSVIDDAVADVARQCAGDADATVGEESSPRQCHSTSQFKKNNLPLVDVQQASTEGGSTSGRRNDDSPTGDIWGRANGSVQESNNEDGDSGSSGEEAVNDASDEINDVEADVESRRRYLTAIKAAAAASLERIEAPLCLPQMAAGSSIPPLICPSSSPSSLALASITYTIGSQPATAAPTLFRNIDDLGFSMAAVNETTTSVSGGSVLPVPGLLPQHHQQQQPQQTALPSTSRNSCKTLKCPKCNWHYKYQETLEIHMREKHPETDAACVYCAGGGAHPRLARGESYTCGYKPYRCDVCNYSTTTKGNLSIHLQSDKHTNNVQELQQNAAVGAAAGVGCPPGTSPAAVIVSVGQPMPTMGVPSSVVVGPDVKLAAGTVSSGTPPSTSSSSGCCPPVVVVGGGGGVATIGQRKQHQQQQALCGAVTPGVKPPKPSWRCDFCGYETTEARNLRIHMTSEKHAHNMLALQQSAAAVSVAHQMALYGPDAACATAAAAAVAAASLLGLGGGTGAGGPSMPSTPPGGQPLQPSAASPFDQFIAGFLPSSSSTTNTSTSLGIVAGSHPCHQGSSSSSNADSPMDLTKAPDAGLGPAAAAAAAAMIYDRRSSATYVDADDSPCLFRCTICDVYSTDSLDALQAHIQLDRSSKPQPNGSDQPPGVAVVAGGTYLCTLCQYRTSLKANFQLHCKTDKHLQRLQLVNHVQEGCLDGSTAGWDRPLPASAVEVRCAACDYRTNSVYRLQMHAASPPHVARATLFRFLCAAEAAAMLSAATVAARNQLRPAMSTRPRKFRCLACGVDARSRLGLIEHAQSAQHVQNEAVHLQSVPGAESADYFRLLGTVFAVETSSSANESTSGE